MAPKLQNNAAARRTLFIKPFVRSIVSSIPLSDAARRCSAHFKTLAAHSCRWLLKQSDCQRQASAIVEICWQNLSDPPASSFRELVTFKIHSQDQMFSPC
jgi:hypothetical protein